MSESKSERTAGSLALWQGAEYIFYVGVYKLSIDTNRVIEVVKENEHLIAKVSTTETIPLIFQSDTKFQFKNLLDASCEFVTENGKVTKFNVIQNGHYEWIKQQ